MTLWRKALPATIALALSTICVASISLGAVEFPQWLQRRSSSSSDSSPTALPEPGPASDGGRQEAERPGILTTAYSGSWVTIRARPTVQSPAAGYGVSGDSVTILREADGLDDRYRWYFVRLSQSPIEGWVRGDLLREQTAQMPEGQQRRPPSESEASQTPSERQTDVSAAAGGASRYSAAEIDYFREVALGVEFGSASEQIRKWNDDIDIRVYGDPTSGDRQTLNRVVEELNQLIGGASGSGVQLEVLSNRDTEPANVEIYFVPHTEFARYEPNYQPGNLGFAYVNWNGNQIYEARILITSTADITQAERSHLIREELTQSLGLLQDSNRYEDSIFYQGWTSTTSYSDLDRTVIRMLYHPDVRTGMSGPEAIAALELPQSASADSQEIGVLQFIDRAVGWLLP